MATVGVVLALVWTRVPKAADRPTPKVTTGPLGTLVYAAAAKGGSGDILWKLDLGTGTAELGPAVPPIREISDASLAGPDQIGLTVAEPDGLVGALLLRALSAEDSPVKLGEGSLVAWGPRGGEVAIARSGPRLARCGSVSIDVVRVATGAATRAFSQGHLCGDLISLGRDAQATYFTKYANGHVGIYYVSTGLPHRVLSGYAMLSVSPASDFLVARAWQRSASEGLRGTLLFWRGTGSPLPFGSTSNGLLVDRTLAWSQDASTALVAGTLGSKRGIFLIRAGPNGTEQAPLFVAAKGKSVGAVFSADGTVYLAIDGRLLRYTNGAVDSIALPAGAPPPAGPLAWLP